MKRICIIILFCLKCYPAAFAQQYSMLRFPTRALTVSDGLLQSVVLDLNFDKYNFAWFSFSNGLQRFDGGKLYTVPIQKGLPTTDRICFFRNENKELFLLHGYGISAYIAEKNQFRLIVKFPEKTVQQYSARAIGNQLYLLLNNEINILDLSSFKISKKYQLRYKGKKPAYIDISDPTQSKDSVFFYCAESSVFRINLVQGSVEQCSNKIDINIPYYIATKDENNLLFLNQQKDHIHLQSHNIINNKTATHLSIPIQDISPGRFLIYNWNNLHLAILGNRIFSTPSTHDSILGELRTLDNALFAASAVQRINTDNLGNLYIGTIQHGIRIIKKQILPIVFLGLEDKKKNYSLAILPDFTHNRILTGANGYGLMEFDSQCRFIKNIKINTSEDDPTSRTPCRIFKGNNNYIILTTSGEIIKMNFDLSIKAIKKLKWSSYFTSLVKENSDSAWVAYGDVLLRIDKNSGEYSGYEKKFGEYSDAGLAAENLVYSQDSLLIFADLKTGIEKFRKTIGNYSGIRNITQSRDGEKIFIGSNKGLLITDISGNVKAHYSVETGLPDECIYAVMEAADGKIWCSSNRGIFAINTSGDVVIYLTENDGLQSSEFNTNVNAIDSSGKFYFGGVNGINTFYPQQMLVNNWTQQLWITKISSNNKPLQSDLAAWNIPSIKLPHHEANLSFQLALMSDAPTDNYVYLYKMEGLDENWSNTMQNTELHYSLEPGKYRLLLSAAAVPDNQPPVLNSIDILILPPFYLTWWFVSLSSLVLLSGIVLIIYFIQKRRYERKLQQLAAEEKIQEEKNRISRDLHDSVGVYAHTVLYQIEQLTKETSSKNKIIEDLKFASKDMITSLRETVWALKKDNYHAEDCWVRIKNFTCSLQRYYHPVKFTITGSAPEAWSGNYQKSLHLVRIVQEAISNAIRHAFALNINIDSSFNDEVWSIRIVDDGIGFDMQNSNESGNGMSNMQHRADEANYKLSILSTRGKGTAVILIIPVRSDNKC